MVVTTRPDLEAWGTTVPPADPFIGLTTLRCRNRKRDGSGQMRHCGTPIGSADLSRAGTYEDQCSKCGAWNVIVVVEAR